MKKLLILLLLISPLFMMSQEKKTNVTNAGMVEIGIRNTISTFGSTDNVGTGFGGQIRLKVAKRINTEWFADFITENVDGVAKRNDYHIGWSVMIYPFNTEGKFVPYILAGHCFDYTKVSPVKTNENIVFGAAQSRLSSATQLGIGTHFNVSPLFDISLSSQYMVHLGDDIHTNIYNNTATNLKEVHIEKEGHGNPTLEGHLLITISVNFKLGRLW